MEAETKHTLTERMLGAARLQVSTYEEVEHDTSATAQAALVVVIVSIATGIGSLGSGGLIGLIYGVVFGIVGWAMWAGVTYFVGTRILPTPETEADWGQLARTLGFAQSPGVLKVLGVIPFIGGFIFLGVTIWQLITMVVAVRQALDYTSTGRAVGVVLIGFIPYLVLTFIALRFLVTP
jgi:hypothetical protein